MMINESRFHKRRPGPMVTSACLAAAASMALGGCATRDAVFVTKTSFSLVDVDSTPAGVSLAHDRVEGYFGPRFDNGHVYPVTGYFRATGNGLGREVQQVFAGGEAASIVLGAKPSGDHTQNCDDDRNNPPLVFATGTTLGIKLGFTQGAPLPNSFVFGYRRKEAAWVPVSKGCQPSVLATLDGSGAARAQADDPKIKAGVGQYFATGAAALMLAKDPTIQSTFTLQAQRAVDNVAAFNSREAEHNQLTLDIIACASKVPEASFDRLVVNADELGVLPDAGDAAAIRSGVDARDRLGRYMRLLRMMNGGAEPRTAALTLHKLKVCKIAAGS